jgi:REP element-mobilizing transposase RayT
MRNVFIAFIITLVEFDGEDDNAHPLVNYPPKVAVSNLVNSLKGVQVASSGKRTIPESKGSYGEIGCGRPATSREVAAVRRLRLFEKPSNSREHRTEINVKSKDRVAVRAIHPP